MDLNLGDFEHPNLNNKPYDVLEKMMVKSKQHPNNLLRYQNIDNIQKSRKIKKN